MTMHHRWCLEALQCEFLRPTSADSDSRVCGWFSSICPGDAGHPPESMHPTLRPTPILSFYLQITSQPEKTCALTLLVVCPLAPGRLCDSRGWPLQALSTFSYRSARTRQFLTSESDHHLCPFLTRCRYLALPGPGRLLNGLMLHGARVGC